MPLIPWARARRTWSRTGWRKASVLPEPVPVVTMVGSGRSALGGQAPVGVLLVLVGGQARVPVERAVGGISAGAGARGQVGQAQADEGADENSLLLVLQEVGEHAPRLGVGEGEGRREVVDDGPTDAFGLETREKERHSWSVVVMGGGVDGGEWCTGVVSAGAGATSCGSSLFRE